jgi:hypothetical protein
LVRTIAFYDATMAAPGYARVFTGSKYVGYGLPGSARDKLLLILLPGPATPPGPGFHLAFALSSREAVDRLHSAALQFGGVDQGALGLGPEYGPDHDAAFVVDPDGYRLETTYQQPERV